MRSSAATRARRSSVSRSIPRGVLLLAVVLAGAFGLGAGSGGRLGLAFGRLVAAGPALGLGGLEGFQAVLGLERTADLLGAVEVVVHAGLGTVFAHEVDDDVHVVVAVLRQSVADGDPAARGFRRVGVVELHGAHEVVGDRLPLLVGLDAFVGAQRQGAVPDVSALHVDLESGVRAVQMTGDRKCGVTAQLGVVVPREHGRIARDEVRFGVLIRAARAGEVDHKTGHTIAAHNVRDHDRLPGSRSSSRSRARSRSSLARRTVSPRAPASSEATADTTIVSGL